MFVQKYSKDKIKNIRDIRAGVFLSSMFCYDDTPYMAALFGVAKVNVKVTL